MTGTCLAVLLAVAPHAQEGDAQAVTALVDVESGATIADGRYAQRVEGGVLHIESRNDFPDGRVIVERAVLRLEPELRQESWDWTERKNGALVRQYEVDFRTGHAVATRVDQHKRWKEDLDLVPGKTFAGIAFVAVIKALRTELAPGGKIDLKAVAFTPKPRLAPVSVTRGRRHRPGPAGLALRRGSRGLPALRRTAGRAQGSPHSGRHDPVPRRQRRARAGASPVDSQRSSTRQRYQLATLR